MMLCGAGLVCGKTRWGTVERWLNDAVWGRSGMWLDKVRHFGEMVD